jgi:hypothetical protein
LELRIELLSDPLPELDTVFFFFSNRMGCLGSLVVSALVTVVLLFLFGMLRFLTVDCRP